MRRLIALLLALAASPLIASEPLSKADDVAAPFDQVKPVVVANDDGFFAAWADWRRRGSR